MKSKFLFFFWLGISNKRYGWGLNDDVRETFHGSEEDFKMNMDDCVQTGHEECTLAINTLRFIMNIKLY